MESYEVFQLDVASAGNVHKNDSRVWFCSRYSFLMSRACVRALQSEVTDRKGI